MSHFHTQLGWLDQTQDAVWVQDLAGRVVYWNRAAEQLYGWPAREMLQQPVAALLLPTEPKFAPAALAAVVATGAWSGETQHQTRAGKTVTVESRWSLLRSDAGEPHAVLVLNTDVTERKELETQIVRAKRLESIVATAGSFAHDMNNVLSPIIMGVELLELRVQDEMCRKMLKTMGSSANRGVTMVKKMLAFARGQEGEQRKLAPADLLQDLERTLRESMPASITVKLESAPDLWAVIGYADQLQEAFLNLCVNAREAMPAGGQLTIAARNLSLDAIAARRLLGAKPGDYVAVSVTDTGTGIAPEIRERIFEPFFTTRGKGKGTGLGLSMVASFVKNHGGVVEVHTTVGAGSTFTVYLPAVVERVAAAPEANLRDQNQSILLVDDEPGLAELAAFVLERGGFRVLTARSGKEALALCSAQPEPIDLAIVDMKMEGMDGVSTIRALRQHQPGMRCILASGHTEARTASEGFNDQPVGFLMKPFTIEELSRKVEATITTAANLNSVASLRRPTAELAA